MFAAKWPTHRNYWETCKNDKIQQPWGHCPLQSWSPNGPNSGKYRGVLILEATILQCKQSDGSHLNVKGLQKCLTVHPQLAICHEIKSAKEKISFWRLLFFHCLAHPQHLKKCHDSRTGHDIETVKSCSKYSSISFDNRLHCMKYCLHCTLYIH